MIAAKAGVGVVCEERQGGRIGERYATGAYMFANSEPICSYVM